MAIVGVGGTPEQPVGYRPPDQPGVAAGNPSTIRARQVIIVGPSQQLLVYTPTAAAGNLVESIASAAFVDQFGNHGLPGNASYAATFATTAAAGFVAFYSGSLAAGWTLQSSVAGDVAGNLQVNATGQLQLIAGAAGVTIQGSANTQQSPNTGFFNTQGLASGSYGSVHQHTLPNFTTATHVHPL